MNNDKTVIIAEPVECLENGCTEQSEKCYNCPFAYLPWIECFSDSWQSND